MPNLPKGSGPALVTAGLVLAGFALALIAAAATAPLDAGTISLAACGGALVYALRRLYALVHALARPDAIAQVGRGAGHFTQAELRDEKRRLLRAIKELEFDHGMGKLSQHDFDSVIGTYRLRAIEVMRALDGGGELHPELQRLLAERDRAAEAAPTARVGPDDLTPREADPVHHDPDAVTPHETPILSSRRSERGFFAVDPPELPGPMDPHPPRPAPQASFEQTSRICIRCNTHNDNDARFCKQCGAAMPRKGREPDPRGPSAAAGEIG